jgi:hypothetical protein
LALRRAFAGKLPSFKFSFSQQRLADDDTNVNMSPQSPHFCFIRTSAKLDFYITKVLNQSRLHARDASAKLNMKKKLRKSTKKSKL